MSNENYDVTPGEPNSCGYLVVGLEIDPESVPTDVEHARKASIATGLQSDAAGRETLYGDVHASLEELGKQEGVLTSSLFEAIYFDPGTLKRHPSRGAEGARIARFDVILIVKAQSMDRAEQLRAGETFTSLVSTMRSRAQVVDIIAASNIKRPADVDRTREGVFLINYFFAENIDPLVNVWDHTAGWWETEGKMANSELLLPTRESDSAYAIVNTARWDELAPAMDAFGSKSYDEYVLANIDSNKATTMPSLYRLVVNV